MKTNTGKSLHKTKKIFVILIIIEFFNGLSGLAGGFGLMSDLTAASLGMDVSWLEGTPFSNYLIPGIVLFFVNGVGNVFAAIISLRRNRHFARAALFFGLIMMIWIISQVAWIGYKSFLQPLYFSSGLLQGILGFLMLKKESN